MVRGITSHRLLALFAAGWLVFDFPLLRLWNGTLWGLPLRLLVLFVAWALLIGVLAAWLEGRDADDGGDADREAP